MKSIQRLFTGIIILLAIILFSCKEKNENIGTPATPDGLFYHGADLSFLTEVEQAGVTFTDENNQAVDVVRFLRSKGLNLVRLRLWHTPDSGHSSLEEVNNMAIRVQNANMEWLLDIHYSDTWADPANQILPEDWQGLSFDMLKDSVYQYTKKVISVLKDQNTLPAIVQIGNETNAGFLWNQGRVGGNYDNNWPRYGGLVKEAIRGIKEIDQENKIKIMFHVSGHEIAYWFFNNLKLQGVDYDIIGISYYSLWHGSDLNLLQSRLNNLALSFGKDILIAETAYPWTLEWNDWTNNIYGLEEQLVQGYPATPEGQKEYLLGLMEIMENISGNKGIGYCWWAPDWVAYKGQQATNGSVWENCTWFNFDFKALPIVNSLIKND